MFQRRHEGPGRLEVALAHLLSCSTPQTVRIFVTKRAVTMRASDDATGGRHGRRDVHRAGVHIDRIG